MKPRGSDFMSSTRLTHLGQPLLVTILGVVILNSAWICDDAYISLRTVDNFVNGFGLRWNIAERVQTFTNPLWTLLLSCIYFFTREAYYTTIVLSIVVSLASVCWLVFRVAKPNLYATLIGVTLLSSSKAFVDYSASGLENPLLHLLVVIFYWIFFCFEDDRKKLFWLCLVGSLSAVNRMDSILLFAPAIGYSIIKVPVSQGKVEKIKYILLPLTPFLIWELFATIYYGFPFPNTAVAKLNTGIPTWDYFVQGSHYYLDSLNRDPITLTTIAAAIIFVLAIKDKKSIVAIAGVALYLIYVLRIGGDFMSGRFFAAPFLVSVTILTSGVVTYLTVPRAAIAFAAILLVAMLNPVSPLRAGGDYEQRSISERGIADERGWYYQGTGLLVGWDVKSDPERYAYAPSRVGLEYKAKSKKVPVRVVGNAGFIGYYSGPNVHLIDHLGLSDPFIARLKPDLNSGWRFGLPSKAGWRIGHFFRYLPEGYFETKLSKKNVIQNPHLAEAYDKLEVITGGKIFTANRLTEIWKFNTGQYVYISKQAHSEG